MDVREQLLQENQALVARNLLKERRYVQATAQMLVRHGASMQTATLAAGLGVACYYAGVITAGDSLDDAVQAAFDRLAELAPR